MVTLRDGEYGVLKLTATALQLSSRVFYQSLLIFGQNYISGLVPDEHMPHVDHTRLSELQYRSIV